MARETKYLEIVEIVELVASRHISKSFGESADGPGSSFHRTVVLM